MDANQDPIVRALRKVGATVQSLAKVGDGTPDLLVGFRRQSYLLEVKDPAQPPSKRTLRDSQEHWHAVWRGLPVSVVETPEDALRAIGLVTHVE